MRSRSLRARLVVQSMCVWNGLVLALVGLVFLIFGERPAGAIVAVVCWAVALALFAIARRVGRGTGWGSVD